MPNIGQQHSIEKSRQLQRNLYLAAKKDKQRRFHVLYDRIFRLDIFTLVNRKSMPKRFMSVENETVILKPIQMQHSCV